MADAQSAAAAAAASPVQRVVRWECGNVGTGGYAVLQRAGPTSYLRVGRQGKVVQAACTRAAPAVLCSVCCAGLRCLACPVLSCPVLSGPVLPVLSRLPTLMAVAVGPFGRKEALISVRGKCRVGPTSYDSDVGDRCGARAPVPVGSHTRAMLAMPACLACNACHAPSRWW